MKTFTNLNKKLQIYFATGALVFVFAIVGLFATSLRTQAYACDKVNIVYCGLKGTSVSDYINEMKKFSSTGTDGRFNDLKTMLSWGGYSPTVVSSMNTTNTKLGTLYRDGHIVVDGRTVATSTWITARFNGGTGFVSVKDGVWARKTTTSMMNATDQVMITFDANGKAIAGTVVRCGNMIQFTATQPPVQRSLICDDLQVAIVPNTRKVNTTVRATPKNTTINSYMIDWGDTTTSQSTGNTSTHTYASDGSYTVKAFVSSTDFSKVTSAACSEVVTVSLPQALECVDLDVTPTSVKNEYTLTATAKPTNTTISGYVFSFGDGQTKQVATTAQTASATHVYQPGKNYVAKVAVSGGKFTNVTSDNCQSNLQVSADKVPGVTITKHVNNVKSAQVAVGESFIYKLKVTNSGQVDLKNVVVTDDAPANVAFLSTDKGSVVGNKLSYTISSLKVEESVIIAITAKVTTQVDGNIKNTACVNAPEVNPNEPSKVDACDDAYVNVPPVVVKNPDISIVKTVNDVKIVQIPVGQIFTYKIVVKNTGDVPMKNVVVTDIAPDGVTLISSETGTTTTNKWTVTIDELKVDESRTFTIQAKVAVYKAGSMINTACVNAPEVNPNEPAKDDACDYATVTVPTPVTPVTPVTPTEPQVLGKETSAPEILPDTGAGSVVGIAAAVAVVSGVAHRLFNRRKFAND